MRSACPLRWVNTAFLSCPTSSKKPTPSPETPPFLRVSRSQDALQLWISTLVLLSSPISPSLGSGCSVYLVMEYHHPSLISTLTTHIRHVVAEQPFLKLRGGRAGHNRVDLSKQSLRLPWFFRNLVLPHHVEFLIDHLCLLTSAACQEADVQPCLLPTSLPGPPNYVSSHLGHSPPEYSGVQVSVLLCFPVDYTFSSSSFLHKKDCVIFHISQRKGNFIPHVKFRCQL